jgi:hypothetical protein
MTEREELRRRLNRITKSFAHTSTILKLYEPEAIDAGLTELNFAKDGGIGLLIHLIRANSKRHKQKSKEVLDDII